MKTLFIFMRGIYQSDQAASYCECLKLLKGKTNQAVCYFRQINNGIELLPDLVEVANDNGIKLTAGFELAGALFSFEPYPLHWHRLFSYSRWDDIIVPAAVKMKQITGNASIALIHEPAIAGFYEGQSIDWLSVESCYRRLYVNGIAPWYDLPIIWPQANMKTNCERYIKVIAKSLSWWSIAKWSNARAMCGYAFDPANDAQMKATHKSIVGPSRFFERLFVTTQTPKPFEKSVEQVHDYLAANRGNPPVLYARFDEVEDGTQICEAI